MSVRNSGPSIGLIIALVYGLVVASVVGRVVTHLVHRGHEHTALPERRHL